VNRQEMVTNLEKFPREEIVETAERSSEIARTFPAEQAQPSQLFQSRRIVELLENPFNPV